jgi:hypothetical protein
LVRIQISLMCIDIIFMCIKQWRCDARGFAG